jgi:uncharacterized protein YpuA (DUF1002 family)
MNTKIKKIITACALFLGLGLTAGRVSAAKDTTPVITLGTSLTASQKQGTLDVLKGALSDSSSYNTLTVTGSDLVTYLNPSGSSFTSSSGVWSSAAIEKTSSGSGINVRILNYNGQNNITTITANQYRKRGGNGRDH